AGGGAGQVLARGLPVDVAGRVVVLHRGADLGVDGLAQALGGELVDVLARDAAGVAVEGAAARDGRGLAEAVAVDADGHARGGCDAGELGFVGVVQRPEALGGDLAARVGDLGLEAAEVGGGRVEVAQLAAGDLQRLAAQRVVAALHAGGHAVVG